MTTPITEYVQVTVSVADRLLQTIDFGIPSLFSAFVEPASWTTGQRTKDYANLTAVGLDFATTTKEFKAAQAVFTADSEFPAPSVLKIMRQDSGDANITDALNAIILVDPNWYAMIATNRVEADVNEIAALIETVSPYIYFASSEDAGVIDGGDATDIASDLQGFAYDRTSFLWHHNSGVDPTITTLTVSSLRTVTAVSTLHLLRVGDLITISGATDFGSDADILNGNFTVATVADANTFTYTLAADATDGLATGTIVCFGRYSFPEGREMGMGIPTVPGAITYFGKELKGQTPAPTDQINLTEQRAARAKNANIYTSIGGLGALQEGQMASGRFIDVQVGVDWIAIRIAEAINQRLLASKKVPYTDDGFAILNADITGVLQTGLVNTLLADRLVGDTKGRAWIITIPPLEDIPDADRANRSLPNVTVEVRFAGAVQNVVIAVSVAL